MPIKVESETKDAFKQWLANAKKKFARHDDDSSIRVAAGN
jgi:heme/copper-type cytochrome/quinol oxidase subunit 2